MCVLCVVCKCECVLALVMCVELALLQQLHRYFHQCSRDLTAGLFTVPLASSTVDHRHFQAVQCDANAINAM